MTDTAVNITTMAIPDVAAIFDVPTATMRMDVANAVENLIDSPALAEHVEPKRRATVRRKLREYWVRLIDGDCFMSMAEISDAAGLPHAFLSCTFLTQMTRNGRKTVAARGPMN